MAGVGDALIPIRFIVCENSSIIDEIINSGRRGNGRPSQLFMGIVLQHIIQEMIYGAMIEYMRTHFQIN